MNGKKWSELGFEFCEMDEDKTMTVKKANKQTKRKSYTNLLSGLWGRLERSQLYLTTKNRRIVGLTSAKLKNFPFNPFLALILIRF